MNHLLQVLLDLLYPPKCPFCGRVVDRGDPIPCPKCRDTLPWVEPGDVCAPPEGCNVCLSPLWYRDLAREAVRRYKFGGGQNHAAVLGTLMAQCLRERWDGPADFITWAPLSARRLRERGYDQAELLARREAAEDEAARAEIDLAARFGLAALDHRDLG